MIYDNDGGKSLRLQKYVMGEAPLFEPLYLAPGDYHIHGDLSEKKSVNMNFHSVVPYAVRIHVHEEPIQPGHWSEISGITFLPGDTSAMMRLDHSSRANVHDNFFKSRKPWDGQGDVTEFEREGIGIITTDDSISEDNWKCRIVDNIFEWLEAGIDCRMPSVSHIGNRLKGVSRWNVSGNDFDGCWDAIRLTHPELFMLQWNHIQLHQRGIAVKGGKTNWIIANSFERGMYASGADDSWDIWYDDETCHMLAIGNTAGAGDLANKKPARISPNVRNQKRHNIYSRPLRKLVLWADCSKGE